MSAVNVGGEADNPDEESVKKTFLLCQQVVMDIESGTFNTKDLQPRIKQAITKLEQLTKDVTTLDLFSDNEFVEELPTSSVQMMLIPCYLGVCHHNLITEPEHRIEELKVAKMCFMDFLKRLHDYEVISFRLPWKVRDEEEVEIPEDPVVDAEKPITRPTGDNLRQEKINRFKHQRELQDALKRAEIERQRNPDDDDLLREMYIIQLRYWAIKLLEELYSIEDEIPILKHMMKVRSGTVKEEAPKPRGPSRPPFIITRSKEQKKVFGLGYPAIPTMTVDEWADGMATSGRWGQVDHHGNIEQPQISEAQQREADLSDSEKEDEVDEDAKRQKMLRWDEYKDTHCRGWGNMHNKG